MDSQSIQAIVEEVLKQLEERILLPKANMVPIAVSARHIHLSEHDLAVLFGPSYVLKKKKDLSQPNQFAAEETVMLAGPKGAIERVRILGPPRGRTQVEVSRTDAMKMGIDPPVRQSGDIAGSSPVTVIGPKGSLSLTEGLIIAQAHIHMSRGDAETFGVHDGQYVKVETGTDRPITFEKVLVRVSPAYKLEMHIDTDEANAGFVHSGQAGYVKLEGMNQPVPSSEYGRNGKPENIVFDGNLLSQADVQETSAAVIRIKKRTVITPLARDTARDLGKKIEIIDA